VSEADAGHIQCWMHAAAAASLPVLWQPPQHLDQHLQQQHGGLAAHEEHQLLADIAIAAAATLCNECFSTSSAAKQVDGAAAALLAAALLPHDGIYGSQRSCISRFTAAVLGSSCCHVLLHALAVSSNAGSSQTALMLAAAAAATPAAAAAAAAAAAQPSGAVSAAASGVGEPAAQTVSAGSTASEPEALVLAAVQQELQLEWLLLRMVCAQCVAASASEAEASRPDGSRSSTAHFGIPAAAGQISASSSSSREARQHSRQQVALLKMASSTRNGSVVQPEQVLRVVQAYSGHDTHAADSHRVAGVLRSLHFLMCQSALALQHGPMHLKLQQQPQQQDPATQRQREQERRQQQRERLQWLDLASDGASSSCSSASETEAAQLSSGGKQLLQTAAGILELINGSITDSTAPAGRNGSSSQASNNSSNGNSGSGSSTSSSMHQLSWELVATVYVSLAITVYLQETATPMRAEGCAATVPMPCLSAADCCLAATALQLAAAALKLLLPVVLMHIPAAAGFAVQEQQQQQQQGQRRHVVLPVHEALTCSLAAVQAVATLSSLIQPALPALLAECISSSSSGSAVLSFSNSKPGSACGNGGAVKLSAARSALAAAAAALDSELQQLLSQVVLSWQAAPASDHSSNSTSHLPAASGLQLSVHVALQQQLQQELRCWAATALATCYGQLGARTWQGAVLEPFRAPDAPFADVHLQLGEYSTAIPAHAAILAAGCSVFRQQLFSAAAAVAGEAGTNGSDGLLVLKLSAIVDEQALQPALDFIYTGAAMLEPSGLAYQLQLCSSCLSHGALPGSRQLHQQKLMALQHKQLQELRDLQQTAKQQLHKLGMLARKLQLPLLTALTRSRKPQPGQRLPDLHVSFGALLPQQMLTPAGVVSQVSKAAEGPGRQEQEFSNDARSLVTSGQQVLKVADAVADGQQQQQEQHEQQQDQGQVTGHVSSTAYLSMLAARSGEDACAATHLGIPAADATAGAQALAASPVAVQQVCNALPVAGSFADVVLAAPILQANQPSALVDSSTDEGSRDQSEQQAGSSQPMQQQQQQQQQLLCGYLPAHRVMLSACCPYFEALLSQRWRHDDTPQHLHGQSGQQQDASASSAQQAACRPVRVVTVPEADIHVAAALLHYLYTGSIAVNLPAATALGPSAAAAPAAAATAAALNGCCRACHEARTLLRLWRCAELLLLPGLQRLCIAAVDAAAWQLSSSCCLALLADCCHLGVPAAADGVIAALTQTAGTLIMAGCCWMHVARCRQHVYAAVR